MFPHGADNKILFFAILKTTMSLKLFKEDGQGGIIMRMEVRQWILLMRSRTPKDSNVDLTGAMAGTTIINTCWIYFQRYRGS